MLAIKFVVNERFNGNDPGDIIDAHLILKAAHGSGLVMYDGGGGFVQIQTADCGADNIWHPSSAASIYYDNYNNQIDPFISALKILD